MPQAKDLDNSLSVQVLLVFLWYIFYIVISVFERIIAICAKKAVKIPQKCYCN